MKYTKIEHILKSIYPLLGYNFEMYFKDEKILEEFNKSIFIVLLDNLGTNELVRKELDSTKVEQLLKSEILIHYIGEQKKPLQRQEIIRISNLLKSVIITNNSNNLKMFIDQTSICGPYDIFDTIGNSFFDDIDWTGLLDIISESSNDEMIVMFLNRFYFRCDPDKYYAQGFYYVSKLFFKLLRRCKKSDEQIAEVSDVSIVLDKYFKTSINKIILASDAHATMFIVGAIEYMKLYNNEYHLEIISNILQEGQIYHDLFVITISFLSPNLVDTMCVIIEHNLYQRSKKAVYVSGEYVEYMIKMLFEFLEKIGFTVPTTTEYIRNATDVLEYVTKKDYWFAKDLDELIKCFWTEKFKISRISANNSR